MGQLVELTREQVLEQIEIAEINKTFLKSADSLWYRFNNYQSQKPIALLVDDSIVCIAFVSKLKRSSYINLYDIVTIKNGKGFGTELYKKMIEKYSKLGVKNIKFRALFSAIDFYDKLGIFFWGFDGKSFTVDQPLFGTIEETIQWRDSFIPVQPNKKLLEDKSPSKKNAELINKIKEKLGNKYYLNSTEDIITNYIDKDNF